MPTNSMDYSAKATVLDVLHTEHANFFALVNNPANWTVQTRCTDWEVRDMVGHMIDVTEGYLAGWEKARRGESAEALGLLVMSERLNEHAQALRSLTREEAIARLKAVSESMLTIFDALDAEAWSNFLVPHPYMGPLPTFFFPAFQIIDYSVHTWDMRWGLGEKTARLDERTAGVLVPYMFILMQSTVDQTSLKGLEVKFSIKVDGPWGGQWHVHVKDGQYTATPIEHLTDTQALFHFENASDFVLTTFQRFPGGETSGDPQVIERVRHMFFRI